MRGIPRNLLATGLLACGLLACSETDIADLEVRTTPQTQAPYSPETSGQPLRGNAVAIAIATE